jgi:HTH-type transcriptional regulator/antitoxin HigA
MDIRPIRTETDYREALAMVDSLWEKVQPGTPDGDKFDVLITLIQAYEREHYPIPPPHPIEAIKFRAEQMGIGRKGLEGIIGTRARVAEVLAGTRPLSIAMIRRLHRELNIPADILIQETRRPTKAKDRPSRT